MKAYSRCRVSFVQKVMSKPGVDLLLYYHPIFNGSMFRLPSFWLDSRQVLYQSHNMSFNF
jgi:hypothetical protein